MAKAVQEWLAASGCKTIYINPGSPWENPYIESFIGTLRDECLNESWFLSLEDAREKVEAWREHYNRERPHGALGNLAPLEFAAVAANAQ